MLFYVGNLIQIYTRSFTLENPTIEQFYVENSQLYLKWSENKVEITKYNIVLYTDDCTNKNTIEMIGGTSLETTIPIKNLTKMDNFYLQIQACSNTICSRSGTSQFISHIEDPSKHINTLFSIIDLFSTVLQPSTVTKNVNDSIVCFNSSIRDKCGTFGTVKINNIHYVVNSTAFVNRTNYFAYPFYNNSWMEYRYIVITDNTELCITNISKFLSEFMQKQKFIIYDQCSKLKKNCSAAINRFLRYFEIGFQHILDSEGEYSVYMAMR